MHAIVYNVIFWYGLKSDYFGLKDGCFHFRPQNSTSESIKNALNFISQIKFAPKMETSHNIKLVAFGDLNTPTYYQLITINFLRIWAILPAGRAPRNLRWGGAAELHLKWGFWHLSIFFPHLCIFTVPTLRTKWRLLLNIAQICTSQLAWSPTCLIALQKHLAGAPQGHVYTMWNP